MRLFVLIFLILIGESAFCQRVNQVPDSLRKNQSDLNDKTSRVVQEDANQSITADDFVKNKLVKLALKNPGLAIDDANIEIAILNRKKAGSSWLSSVALGGNVNEFVIKNSPQSNFYPKYNAGISVPLDIFSRLGNEKKIADQNIVIAEYTKKSHESEIKLLVLTRYENFKEKNELVTLQNIYLANQLSDYQLAQESFKDGSISIDALNKIYQNYMTEKNRLVSYKRDLNVAVFELEEVIGMPLQKAIPGVIVN